MKKNDIKKLANDYDHLALIKLTTGNAEAIDKLNGILNKLDGNVEYIYDDDDEPEPPYDWCISDRMVDDVTTAYYVYFNAYYAGKSELADFLIDYDTELVGLLAEYDLETFDYMIDNDFNDFDNDGEAKEDASDIVPEDEDLTITRVWKNKAGEVSTALVNDV